MTSEQRGSRGGLWGRRGSGDPAPWIHRRGPTPPYRPPWRSGTKPPQEGAEEAVPFPARPVPSRPVAALRGCRPDSNAQQVGRPRPRSAPHRRSPFPRGLLTRVRLGDPSRRSPGPCPCGSARSRPPAAPRSGAPSRASASGSSVPALDGASPAWGGVGWSEGKVRRVSSWTLVVVLGGEGRAGQGNGFVPGGLWGGTAGGAWGPTLGTAST